MHPNFSLDFVYSDMTGLGVHCKFGNGMGVSARRNGDMRATSNGPFQLLSIDYLDLPPEEYIDNLTNS